MFWLLLVFVLWCCVSVFCGVRCLMMIVSTSVGVGFCFFFCLWCSSGAIWMVVGFW